MIEIKNLTAGYGIVKILRNVSIQMKEGECIGIIGPNGAGKSTLLQTISGTTKIFSGEVFIDGELVNSKHSWNITKKGIAHVPEGRLLFGTLTVRENMLVALDSMNYPKNKYQERFEYVWDIFPILKQKWNSPAGSLSGGQQQMVAVGRGLVVDPKVLLLDEPSLGLAPIVTQEIRAAVEKLKGKMSIVVADQNATMVLRMTQRVYVISEGSVTMESNSTDLVENEALWKAYMNE